MNLAMWIDSQGQQGALLFLHTVIWLSYDAV